jgi:hypothetical protein
VIDREMGYEDSDCDDYFDDGYTFIPELDA